MAAAPPSSVEALLAQCYPGVRVTKQETVQSLWGGYGQILRLHLEGCAAAPGTVVVKRVAPPDDRGISHERKCRSYVVEQAFYEQCASRLDPALCRVPKLLGSGSAQRGETLFVLEDLDAVGFGDRRYSLSLPDARACVVWLAHFHRTFLGTRGTKEGPDGLWEQVRRTF